MSGKITRQELDQTIVTPLNNMDAAISTRASQASVDAVSTAVAARASQASLDTVSAAVAARASQASLDTVSAAVAARASQASLDTVSAAVAARATQTSVNTISANVGSDADIASAAGSIHAKLKDIKASSGVDLMAIPSDTIRFERLGFAFGSNVSGAGGENLAGSFVINVSGAVRITFTGRPSTAGWSTVHYSIRKNGIVLIQQVSPMSNHETPFFATLDFPVGSGDVIEIWGTSSGMSFSDFRIRYTLVEAKAVLLNSNGGLIHHQ